MKLEANLMLFWSIPRNRKQFKGKLTGIVYDGIEMPSEKGIEFGMTRNWLGGIGDTNKVKAETLYDMTQRDVFESPLDDKVREHFIHHTLREFFEEDYTRLFGNFKTVMPTVDRLNPAKTNYATVTAKDFNHIFKEMGRFTG